MNICQICGTLNNEEILQCENCGVELNSEILDRMMPFVKNAVYYGYLYRQVYEEQVKEQGVVTIKFSLLQPSNYYELLGVFALSGYIGGVSFQLVNYIGKQIIEFVKTKFSRDKDDDEIIDFLGDEAKVRQFVQYIIEYYKGYPIGTKLVSDAIIEEEMADFASHQKGEEFGKMIKTFSTNKHEELIEFFTEIAKGTGERRRQIFPQKDDIKKLFKKTKKELKKEEIRKREKRK